MSSEEMTQRVLKAIATSKRIPLEQVTIDSDFEQLNIDSMDAVEILFALENEFDINIPDEEVREVRNVRQMVEGVAKLVAAKAAAPRPTPAAPADAAAGQ
jgi:acyl carrier protein